MNTAYGTGKFPSCSFQSTQRATVRSISVTSMSQGDGTENLQSYVEKYDDYNEGDEFPGSRQLMFGNIRSNLNENKKRAKQRKNAKLFTPPNNADTENSSHTEPFQAFQTNASDVKTEVDSGSALCTEEMSRNTYVCQRRSEPIQLPSASPNGGTDFKKIPLEIKNDASIKNCIKDTEKLEAENSKTDGRTTEPWDQGCCEDKEKVAGTSTGQTTESPAFEFPGNQRCNRFTKPPSSISLKQQSHKQPQISNDINNRGANEVTVRSLGDMKNKMPTGVKFGIFNSGNDQQLMNAQPKPAQVNYTDEYVYHIRQLMNGYKTPFIDSHCHLDYIFNKMFNENGSSRNNNIGCNLREWKNNLQVFPQNFQGCIPNFIDPRLYYETDENIKYYDLDWLQHQVTDSLVLGATYGIHPKYAHLHEQVSETLFGILADKKYRAVAVGECGLDTYRNFENLETQKAAFETQLRYANELNLPVVIHCRSDSTDDAYKTEVDCLNIMSRILSPFHTIHRHCFTMNMEVYDMWIKAFPNTFFGFTPCIEKATDAQLEAVRKIPITRILLETDAPYFRPQMFDMAKHHLRVGPPKTSFPGMAICTAQMLSNIKQIPLENVLDITAQNTRRCYRLTEHFGSSVDNGSQQK